MKFTIRRQGQYCLLFLLLTILVGCNTEEAQDVSREDILGKSVPLELYVLEDVPAGKYEPEIGIYTGAYVEKDPIVQGDISAYETLIKQPQTFKIFQYQRQQGISKQDILKCIAQKKIPYIKIVLGTDYDLTPLYQMIFDLKDNYKTPIFIELYPLTEKNYTPKIYKETYQRAYAILHKYLDQVVVVWSVDEPRLSDIAIYDPGTAYMDWAGVNIYIPRYKDKISYTYQDLESLDYWYKYFQEEKPLLISGLAVSHFSKIDHTYAIQEGVKTLSLFYQEALERYPRLRGILYMDVDMAQISSMGKDNYTLTEHPQLIEAMEKLSLPLEIHTQLVKPPKEISCYQKYYVEGKYFEDKLYIPQEYMAICFKKVPLRKIKHIEDLSGEIYYDYEEIKNYCTSYRI